nr:hypothetical protein [uncultured Bacteroides sp.]
MARTITEIGNEMKASFIANIQLQNMYGFADTDTFDNVFSVVSLERIIIYIVATAIWMLENLFDTFSSEITTKIDNAIVTSIPWYYNAALLFQYGDDLVFNTTSYRFGYAIIDATKQIVKFAAIREVVDGGVTKLKIYYSGTDKLALTTEQKTAFEAYIRRIGAAGTHYLFMSQDPDLLGLTLNIYYDPLILDSTGKKITDSTKPVDVTIADYLNNIKYGGVFYSSALVDALQATEGVKDVELVTTYWDGSAAERRKIDAISGAFKLDTTNTTITYSLD